MAYYDLFVQMDDAGAAATQAKLLGFSGIAARAVPAVKDPGFDFVNAVVISPKTPDELHSELERIRQKYEIIAVSGGDYEVNRASCEDNRVDILLHPEKGRMDSGIDHICAKSAADNGVSISIVFSELLNSKNRPREIYFLQRNAYLCRKYGARMISVSGASGIWEMRAPREMASIAHVMGLEINEAIASVSSVPEEKIAANREKLSGSRFGEVRLVKGD